MQLLWYEAVHLPRAEQGAPSFASGSALVRPLGLRASTLGTRDLTFLQLRAALLCPAPCKLAQWLLWVLVAAVQSGSVAVGGSAGVCGSVATVQGGLSCTMYKEQTQPRKAWSKTESPLQR